MKIVMIGTVASSFYGFRKDLIKSLLSEDHQVYAFTTSHNDRELHRIKALGAIPIIYKGNRSSLNIIKDLLTIRELSEKINNISPDLVFSFFSKPLIYGTMAAKIARVPRIIGMLEGLGYTFTPQPYGSSLKDKSIKAIQISLYKISIPFLDKVVFLNPDDPKDLIKKYNIKANKVEVLGGIGLNLAEYEYCGSYPDTLTFIFIARLIAEKGIRDFVSAAKVVKKKYPFAKFVVLGAIDKNALGALTNEELSKLIDEGIIEYPGRVDNVSKWLKDSSVFVLPSYYREGVPRSTQEAMATGRAIITTDVPGCRETVVDNLNGFLVKKWSPKAIAEKMFYFIENPNKVQEMGLESFKLAKAKYDAEIVNKKLMSILLEE